jgi:hypothetical protein
MDMMKVNPEMMQKLTVDNKKAANIAGTIKAMLNWVINRYKK